MSLESPAPRVLVSRRAEDAELIRLVVARELTVRRLDRLEDLLQLHDGRRRCVAARAETGLEKIPGQRSLRFGHLLDLDALARELFVRHVVPVKTLVGIERERRALPLIGRERGQP